MKVKTFLVLIISFFFIQISYSKEIIFQGSSTLKQTKLILESGELVFSEKYQNLNGKITQEWFINGAGTNKENYFKRIESAEKEEKELVKREEERKKQEEELKKQEFLAQKEKEEEEFRKIAQLEGFKKLVSLELEKACNSFAKLDKYSLEEYFVFGDDTFVSLDSLQESKVSLVNKAKELTIRSLDELEKDELKNVLEELEVIPGKVERFFRKSVRYAINQCDDTKRLKELLSLI